jgi:cytochrome c biogenesis protein CcmG/thiol:disulfide interchange protein DsbE
VVNFVATWCRPCVAEHHILVAAAKKWGDRVRFLGVVYEDTDANILKFLKRGGSAYPTLVDVGGRTAIAYGVYGVPETFFISPAGTIDDKHAGPVSMARLNRGIAAAARAK